MSRNNSQAKPNGEETKTKTGKEMLAAVESLLAHALVVSKDSAVQEESKAPTKKKKKHKPGMYQKAKEKALFMERSVHGELSDSEISESESKPSLLADHLLLNLKKYDARWFARTARDHPEYFIDFSQYDQFARQNQDNAEDS